VNQKGGAESVDDGREPSRSPGGSVDCSVGDDHCILDDISVKDQWMATWAQGRILEALAAYYHLTGDARWKQMGEKAVLGLRLLVLDRGEYAYFDKIIYAPGEAAPKRPDPTPVGQPRAVLMSRPRTWPGG
jgi:hypothetical protein